VVDVRAPRAGEVRVNRSPRGESFADVQRAVAAASARGLRVAVRATGHGTFAAPGPDTLVIDTSGLRSVLVDPGRRVARVGAGATHGLGADNLLRADIVTADGELLTASSRHRRRFTRAGLGRLAR
jgi:FAD/FMN-containing dehydrogenase